MSEFMNEVSMAPSLGSSRPAEIAQPMSLTGFQEFEHMVSDPNQIGFTAKEITSILRLSFEDEDY
jgi:hypothetical protein